MKKLLYLLFLLPSLLLADSKVSDLTETTSPSTTDYLYIVKDGTSKKVKVGNVSNLSGFTLPSRIYTSTTSNADIIHSSGPSGGLLIESANEPLNVSNRTATELAMTPTSISLNLYPHYFLPYSLSMDNAGNFVFYGTKFQIPSILLTGPDGPSYLKMLAYGSGSEVFYIDESSATFHIPIYLQDGSVLTSTSTFLTTSSATATYFQATSSTTLLTTSSATATYLQKSSATANYPQFPWYYTGLGSKSSAGGLLFDGATSGEKFYHPISSIGSSDCSIHIRLRVPKTNPPSLTYPALFALTTNNATVAQAYTFWGWFNSAGKFEIDLQGYPSSNYKGGFINNFISNYAGQLIDLVIVKNVATSSMTIYVNGTSVAYNDTNNGGSPPAWSGVIQSSYCVIGFGGGTQDFFWDTIYKNEVFNRALTQADVLNLSQENMDPADQWGNLVTIIDTITPKLNGGFETAGTGGDDVFANWSEVKASAVISSDTVVFNSGASSLKIVEDAGGSGAYISQNVLTVRKKYRASFYAKVDSTGTTGAPIIGVGDGTATGSILRSLTTSWALYSGEFTASNAAFAIAMWSNIASRTIWVDDVTLNQIGCILDSDLENADPSKSTIVQDRSSNNSTGTVTATGITQIKPLDQINPTYIFTSSITFTGDGSSITSSSDVMTRSSVTANYPNFNKYYNDMNARLLTGGISFDRTTNTRIFHPMGSIGASDYSIHIKTKLPETLVSYDGLLAIQSNSSLGDQPYGLEFQIGSTGNLYIFQFGATVNDYRLGRYLISLAPYAGQVIDLAFVRVSTLSAVTLYLNGVAQSAASDVLFGTAPAWNVPIISSYAILGACSGGQIYGGTVYKFQIFNRALSANDITRLMSDGIENKDEWGNYTTIIDTDTPRLNGGFELKDAAGGTVTNIVTSSRSTTGHVSTLYTATSHGLTSGNHIAVTLMTDTGYNTADATVTVLGISSFTYPTTHADEALTADTAGRVGTSLFTNWLYYFNGSDSNISVETTTVHSGTQSVKMQTYASGGLAEIYQNGLTVGKRYRLSLWARGAVGGETIDMGDGTSSSEQAQLVSLTTTWTLYIKEFTSTGNTSVMVKRSSGVNKIFYLDDFKLERIGVTLDSDLENADPSKSLVVQDRSSNVYIGLATASGLNQVKPEPQINPTNMIASTVSVSSIFNLPSQTIAQLNALNPIPRVNMTFYCSDCTSTVVCISTGTAVRSFSSLSDKTVHCN